MEKENIQELLAKYNEGQADPSEVKRIEQLIEEGAIDLTELHELNQLNEQVMKLEDPTPSGALDDQFYAMLAKMKRKSKGFSWAGFLSWPQLAPRLAIASVTLLLGIAAGYYLKPSEESVDVVQLNQQLSELREMMMFSLLEKESATDRLKAVSLTQEMDGASTKVTEALIRTLENDPNINVRLSALEALKPYVRNDSVREKLVRSIAKQESPLVQVALAELMVVLQERSSVGELKKIIENESTPAEVKKRIEESIKIMI